MLRARKRKRFSTNEWNDYSIAVEAMALGGELWNCTMMDGAQQASHFAAGSLGLLGMGVYEIAYCGFSLLFRAQANSLSRPLLFL